MAQGTKIEWATATWNPWQGCHKVSPACAHCYMFRDKERYGQDPNTVVRSKPATFDAPLHWKEQEPRVFTCSWSDFFIEEADPWRAEAFEIIRSTPHAYLILTKRAERALELMPRIPLPNVWLGVSVENQYWARQRIPLLMQTPAAVRFLSCEPLLGPLDLIDWLPVHTGGLSELDIALDWVIVGGESGPKERPLHLDHVRSVRDQCIAARVPFFFKQFSGATMLEVKAKGRLLDGREWNEFPLCTTASK